jgi:predicted outer membrane protein
MPARHLMTMAATLLFAASPLFPMHAQAGTTPPNDSVSADAKLIRQAAADNLLEVKLGELAQHQAKNPTVQKFGERMVNDHGRLEKQWTDLAAKHGTTVKAALSSKKQKKIDRLRQATGATFDREYMIAMIKGHAKTAAELEAQVDSARSEPVRKMAAYALPIVREHLLAAQAAAKEVGVDSATVARSQDRADK